jgi:hypothetical protein
LHVRATTAAQQCCHMLIELSLNSFCSHSPVGPFAYASTTRKIRRATGPWLQRLRRQAN